MPKNYMPEVAKLIGVEINEEFALVTSPEITCKLTEFGLEVSSDKTNIDMGDYWLTSILGGKVEIKRPPWKPTTTQSYYFVDEHGDIHKFAWKNNWIDNLSYKVGNCYRTKEEAESNKNKWIAFYASDKILEV